MKEIYIEGKGREREGKLEIEKGWDIGKIIGKGKIMKILKIGVIKKELRNGEGIDVRKINEKEKSLKGEEKNKEWMWIEMCKDW